MIPIQVTSHALRCIDKAGGLDNYVLNTRAEKMMSTKGLELKEKIMRALLKVEVDGGVGEDPRNDSFPPPPQK